MTKATAAQLREAILADFDELVRSVARWRRFELADVEVTMSQARCLMLVSLHPSMPISALASHLRIGLPAASGLVDRLVDAGQVERKVDPGDRRHQLVTLTERGQAAVDRLHELPAEKLGQLLAGLSLNELRGLRLGVAAIAREAGRIADSTPAEPEPERTPA